MGEKMLFSKMDHQLKDSKGVELYSNELQEIKALLLEKCKDFSDVKMAVQNIESSIIWNRKTIELREVERKACEIISGMAISQATSLALLNKAGYDIEIKLNKLDLKIILSQENKKRKKQPERY